MNDMSPIHRSARETFIPLRIAALYALVGGVWVLSSDRLLGLLVRDPQLANRLQTFKGWLYVLVSAVLIYVLVKRDIVVISRAESSLRESEIRYRELFDNIHSGVAVYEAREGGADFIFTDLNQAGLRIGRYRRETVIGRSVLEVFPGVQELGLFQVMQRVWQTGQPERHPVSQYQDERLALWVENYVCRLPSGEIVAVFEDVTERVRAEEALRQYSVRLKALYETDQAILAARSAEEIGRAALDHLQELLPCRVSSVTMYDFEARTVVVLAARPERKTGIVAGTRLPLDVSGGARELAQRREPRVVEDITALPHPTPIEGDLLAEGVRSYVNIPLVAQDELIGSLNLGLDRAGAWETAHLDIAREVADSLAVATQSARLIDAERVRLMRESTLLSLANVAGSTLDLDEVMTTVLDSLRQLISCDSATIQLLEDDALRTAAAVGFDDQSPARSFVYALDKYPLNRQLIEERQPIRIDDVRLDDRYVVVPGKERARAFVGVPLLAKGRPVGVITVDGRRPGQFTEYDVELAAAVAAHVAVAVENARLFAETRWRAERMAALHDATAAINRAVTVADAFATIRQQVMALLPGALPPVFAVLGEDGHTLIPHIVDPTFPLIDALRQATGLELADLLFSFHRARPETRALLEAGQPFVSDDLVSALSHSVPEHGLLWARDTLGMRGVNAVPFAVEGRLLGLMLIFSPGRLPQEDLELLTIFANQAAIVLDRAYLFEEVRAGREQLRELADYLQNAREEERTLIAREIHDEFGQMLTALKIDLAWIGNRLPEGQTALIAKTASMSGLVDDTIQLVRRIATDLRPGLLDDLGLAAAIEWQAEEFAERTGIDCDLYQGDQEIVHDQNLATALFRILQETLTNVARHAKASRVRIDLAEEPGAVTLIIRDDGVGITQERIDDSKSLGLVGMRERAYSWGGQVTFEGVPGQGTTVTVRIPKSSPGEPRE